MLLFAFLIISQNMLLHLYNIVDFAIDACLIEMLY